MKTAAQITKHFASTGTANVRDIYLRQGADEAYGVPLAAVRAVAKEIGKNHALGLELWKTGVHEARIVACTILDPSVLTEKEARALIGSARYAIMNDELVSRVVTEAPFAAELGVALRAEEDDYLRRAGWKIVASRIADGHEDAPAAVLARLEKEMPSAPFRVKEGMNYCLVQIGTRVPELTERAVAFGEKLGVWDVRPILKGCTSAYAPEWIAVLLARKSPTWKARAAEAVAVRDAALKAAKAAGVVDARAEEKAQKSAATKKAAAPAKKNATTKAAAPAKKNATTKAATKRPVSKKAK